MVTGTEVAEDFAMFFFEAAGAGSNWLVTSCGETSR